LISGVVLQNKLMVVSPLERSDAIGERREEILVKKSYGEV
jgi:hypothetical protein